MLNMEFKEGDVVELTKKHDGMCPGSRLSIVEGNRGECLCEVIAGIGHDGGGRSCYSIPKEYESKYTNKYWSILRERLKLIKTTMTSEKSVPQGIKQNTTEEIQTLYKAGLLNGDLELTETGERTILNIIAKKYEEDLLKAADEILGYEEADEE